MKIGFRWVSAVLFALPLISLGGDLFAAPAGVPQQMLPSYVPASPSRGVASFRPHYRSLPARPMTRFRHPANRPPVRSAGSWPIPVSYRPVVPVPQPRYPAPYGYRGRGVQWTGQPLPVRGRGVRPMRWMAYNQPARPPLGVRGYPRSGRFSPWRPDRPMLPTRYRQPNRMMPRPSLMPRPYPVYPHRQAYPVRSMPRPALAPGRFAGRYQPYSGVPGSRPNYRFRPMPQRVAYQGYPVMPGYPAAPPVPAGYRFWQGPGNPGTAARSAGAQLAGRLPERPIRRGEVLAWQNSARQLPRMTY